MLPEKVSKDTHMLLQPEVGQIAAIARKHFGFRQCRLGIGFVGISEKELAGRAIPSNFSTAYPLILCDG